MALHPRAITGDDLPEVLLTEEAAYFCRCKNSQQFLREVRAGVWPGPIGGRRPFRFSKSALQKTLDPSPANDEADEIRRKLDERLQIA